MPQRSRQFSTPLESVSSQDHAEWSVNLNLGLEYQKPAIPSQPKVYDNYIPSQRSMTDFVTPRYQELIARGEVVASPMTMSSFSRRGQNFVIQTKGGAVVKAHPGSSLSAEGKRDRVYVRLIDPNRPYPKPEDELGRPYARGVSDPRPEPWECGSLEGFTSLEIPWSLFDAWGSLPAPDPSALEDLALSSAFARAHQGDVQALVTVAEAPSTIRTISSYMKQAYRLLRAFKRLDLKYLKGQLSLKELQNQWLSARYGIRPLIGDVRNVADAILSAKTGRHRSSRRSFRGRAEDTFSSTVNDVTWRPPGTTIVVSGSLTSFGNLSSRATVVVGYSPEVANNFRTELTRMLSLGAFIDTAWELIPYSFVVDWFANIGDVLSSWQPIMAGEVLTACVTTQTTISSSFVANKAEGLALPSYSQYWYRASFQGGPSYPDWPEGEGQAYGWIYRDTYYDTKVSYGEIRAMSDPASATITASGNAQRDTLTKVRRINPSKPLLPHIKINLNAAKLVDLVGLFRQRLRN